MWVINIRHWLDDTNSHAAAPQLKNKVKKLTEIIIYSTSNLDGLPIGDPPKCWRRPKRKSCDGILQITFNAPEEIYWKCSACGDEGIVTGWDGLIWDMSDKKFVSN